MKFVLMSIVLLSVPLSSAMAQQDSSGKTLASTIEVFVFPAAGQDSAKQSTDEVECYNWATSNTGSDPFELTKLAAAQETDAANAQENAAKTGQGSGARGAVRGAAVGALIGEIANDDASEGAAYGAAAGLVAGRRRGRAASQQAQAEAEKHGEQQQQATQEQIGNFKKAFSVCLEAKEYMVKY